MGSYSSLKLLPDDKNWRRRTLACGCVLGEYSAHIRWCDTHWKEARKAMLAEPDYEETRRALPERRGVFTK